MPPTTLYGNQEQPLNQGKISRIPKLPEFILPSDSVSALVDNQSPAQKVALTLPETNSLPDGWNTSFLLGWLVFRGELLVSGRVARFFKGIWKMIPVGISFPLFCFTNCNFV